jgi:hypothetical protein
MLSASGDDKMFAVLLLEWSSVFLLFKLGFTKASIPTTKQIIINSSNNSESQVYKFLNLYSPFSPAIILFWSKIKLITIYI